MRKILLVVFLAVLLAGCGVAALWFVQATKIEKKFAEQVTQFNSGPVQLTYDNLKMSGFPLRQDLNLVNPKLAGRMDLLIDPNKKKNLPEWNETLTLQGIMRFGIDALSSRAEFSVDGAIQSNSVIDGQSLSVVTAPETSSLCSLQISRDNGWLSSLWSFDSWLGQGEAFFTHFRLFDCFTSGVKILETSSKAVLMEGGPQRIYISSAPKDTRREVRFYLKGTDSMVTQDGDRVIAQYYRALKSIAIPPMVSAYGKQNVEIDLTYAGPINWQGDPMAAPIEFHLSQFNLTNDAYNIHSTFDLTNSVDAQSQSAHIRYKSEAIYSQIFSALLQETIRSTIRQSLSDPKLGPALSTLTQDDQNTESMYALISTAVPDLHALGKLTSALDLSFKGEPGFTSGDFTLTTLEFSSTPYGITANGTGKRVPTALMPALNLTIVCRNCMEMFDAIAGYSNRVLTVVKTLSPEKPVPLINPATIKGYKDFLQAIATDDGAGNLSYIITSDGKSGFVINKKHMSEIIALQHKYLPTLH